ncbi:MULTISPECIES: hypothetical protein [unclassified Desulfovibrio]|uniref:hypothetical protein n=1 Tax=unclassified Desulfovibrio TaxID=2593640 RepID=UPI0013EB861A|nr:MULTISPECIES: hypothetical protein [unclassified Desulfovibrio]
MSQMPEELNPQGAGTGEPGATPEELEQQFDAGFDMPGEGETTPAGQDTTPGDTPQALPETEPAQSGQQEEPELAPQVQLQPEPQPAPQPQPAPEPVQQPQSEEPKQLETVPEELAEELKELEAISPAAAKLAMEDSAEGAAVRERLTNFGAAMAQDRAEFVLAQRAQAQKEATAEAERYAAAVRTHNDNFLGTIKRELPDYYALVNDPARKAEAAKYQQDVYDWIGSKPYAEAAPLMDIAKSGRDVNQVVSLLKQFESERRGGKAKPDPTGALAVPGRGAPTAPAGIGDKDDFDAGWGLE